MIYDADNIRLLSRSDWNTKEYFAITTICVHERKRHAIRCCAKIGAGSIVVKDMPPFTVAFGNPN